MLILVNSNARTHIDNKKKIIMNIKEITNTTNHYICIKTFLIPIRCSLSSYPWLVLM